jgi:hypothetical protein
MPEAAFCHRHHHHRSDKDAILVVQQFPTAVNNKQNTDPGQTEMWWISDDTGSILSETSPGGAQVYFPTEADAWESAYLISVLGRTVHDIQVAAYFDWENAGRPEGEDLEFWLDGKSSLETLPAPPTE